MSGETRAVLPFHPQRPCEARAEFHGRAYLATDLVSLLAAEEMPAISIVGEPRAGKTSFLRCLPQLAEEGGAAAQRAHYVLIDFAAERFQSQQHFFGVLREMEAVAAIVGEGGVQSYRDFEEIVDTLQTRDERLVLLFDNFHEATLTEALRPNFFEYLRSKLSTCRALGCVVTSPASLETQCHEQLRDSPFFNIFSTRVIGPLAKEEARELLLRRLPERLQRAESVEQIIAAVGGSPYLLHVAGECWTEQWRAGRGADLEPALQEAYVASREHYHAIWKGLAEKQQALIERVVRREAVPAPQVDHVLVDRGWLSQEGSRLRLATEHFEQFMCEQLGIERRRGFFDRFLQRKGG